MKWLYFFTALCSFGLASNPGVYIISRLYEGLFFYGQYDYFGIKDNELYTKVTYGEKILCLKEDFSKQMEECLKGNEPDSHWMFSERKHMKTFWVSFKGKEYVVKKHVQYGFFKNIMQMGKGVSIWNNLHWAKKRGLAVVEPVAVREKREMGRLETTVVYRYEGSRTDYFKKEDIKSKTSLITPQLREKNIVHADLRRRNIIYEEGEETVKLIDVELMHFYPSFSYVCTKRLTKEERWLRKDYKS